MSQVLNKIRDVDLNDSDAVKEVVASFFQNLSNYRDRECYKWLQALESIINRFPKYCATHRSTIETYLTHFLESKNYYYVILAAKCSHALQQVKPSQDKACTPQSCWCEQMNILCYAGHLLTDEIFAESVNVYKNSEDLELDLHILQATKLTQAFVKITKNIKTPNEALSKKEIQSVKLRNIFIFIQAMLVEIYPTAKPIRPQIILEVIMQVLSITGNIDRVVASVKIEALRTINALIACLGSNLIPFSTLVFRLIMQTLRLTSENQTQESRKVRCAAYTSLTKWLRVLNVHKPSQEGRGRLWEDEITSHILDDITPHTKIVQLTMNLPPNKKLSKKAKKRLANTMLQESAIASHMPGEKNKSTVTQDVCDETALAALECAETFLNVYGIFLKASTHKVLQERLVRECYGLSTYSMERGLWLLRCLDSARKSVPPGIPPPTQYCLQLFSKLLNTHQGEIQKFCSQALLDIRMHLHCSPPSLTFNMDVHSESKNKVESKKKMMSDRNRAVLESLLGAERMPSDDLIENNEDVISIPDEPSNKKPRLEDDITDRITLSSDSENSIEISDESEPESSIVQKVVAVIEDTKGDKYLLDATELETQVETNEETKELQGKTGRIENDVQPNGSSDIMYMEQNKENMDKSVINENELEKDPINKEITESRHETKTQLPSNMSNDIDDDEPAPSMEVSYDYPNEGKDYVMVLEKTYDENIPSSVDTDDVEIICGQMIKDSQAESGDNIESTEQNCETPSDLEKDSQVPVENGIDKSIDKTHDNVQVEIEASVDVSVKAVDKPEVLTVEDMLADFVDEVIEENQIGA